LQNINKRPDRSAKTIHETAIAINVGVAIAVTSSDDGGPTNFKNMLIKTNFEKTTKLNYENLLSATV
jgi:hypothetical protein